MGLYKDYLIYLIRLLGVSVASFFLHLVGVVLVLSEGLKSWSLYVVGVGVDALFRAHLIIQVACTFT